MAPRVVRLSMQFTFVKHKLLTKITIKGGLVRFRMEEMAAQASVNPEIPDKLYFRIGEVAKLAGIKPYVLRFWETEFSGLSPKKSGTGHRLYRRKDVELVLEIKRLLYEKRFTIEGARKVLEAKPKREPVKAAPARRQGELFTGTASFYQDLRRELQDIMALLEDE